MSQFEPVYRSFGERSILVEWPSKIDEEILKDIVVFKKKLENSAVEYLVEVNTSYNWLLISYSRTIDNFYDRFTALKTIYTSEFEKNSASGNLWKIPVCYDEKYATDLVHFSEQKDLSLQEVIQLHASTTYRLYFIGFLPGFLYLGGLNKRLHLPRKETPDLNIKKGSVAIGGEQTGVYPQNSPGGWHIIGNSPINFFDIQKQRPCFASAGDKIQFVPVDLETHDNISALVEAGVFQLESEVIHD